MAKTAQAAAGMEKPELRKHIVMARRKPLHIAFALDGSGRPIIVMHPRQQPRALEKQIKEEASDSKNHRFGLLRFDEDEPDVARIIVNKPSAGMAKKLMVALKGTGVRHIELLLEDGTSLESAANDDDEDRDQGDDADETESGDAPEDGSDIDAATDNTARTETDTAQADMDVSAPEAEAAPAGPDGAPDGAALVATLKGLIQQMMAAIAADPSRKSGLVEMATDAQASLKRGDLAQAAAGIAVLTAALGAAPAGATAAGDMAAADTAAPAAPAPPGQAAVQRYRKARKVWDATRSKLDADLQTLSSAILSVDHGGQFGDDLGQQFLDGIDPVLSTLDDSLAGLLEQAEQASDQTAADAALDQARTTIGLYQQFVSSDATIQALDGNPFKPMAIGKMLNASLAALAAAMH